MALLKVYNGASWDTIVAKVWNGAAWVEKLEFYDGSGFVRLYGPQVSANALGDSNIRVGNDCYAGVQFASDGTEYQYTNIGGLAVEGDGWLDSGLNSEVWVNRVVTAGSWNDLDPGAGRNVLSANRSFRVIRTTLGTQSVTGYFQFWDAATGGNLLQQTPSAVYSAQKTI